MKCMGCHKYEQLKSHSLELSNDGLILLATMKAHIRTDLKISRLRKRALRIQQRTTQCIKETHIVAFWTLVANESVENTRKKKKKLSEKKKCGCISFFAAIFFGVYMHCIEASLILWIANN